RELAADPPTGSLRRQPRARTRRPAIQDRGERRVEELREGVPRLLLLGFEELRRERSDLLAGTRRGVLGEDRQLIVEEERETKLLHEAGKQPVRGTRLRLAEQHHHHARAGGDLVEGRREATPLVGGKIARGARTD